MDCDRLQLLGVKMLFIEPNGVWENVDLESFNGKLLNELLHDEIVDSLKATMMVIENR